MRGDKWLIVGSRGTLHYFKFRYTRSSRDTMFLATLKAEHGLTLISQILDRTRAQINTKDETNKLSTF